MKTLVLVRHGHRDLSDPEDDNGLSGKGRAQAEAVLRFYRSRFGEEGAVLLSSPKKRCLETLKPLSESLGVPVQEDRNLLEGGRLRTKVAAFGAWWRDKAPARVVACSHGDWIPAFLGEAGASTGINKGGWAELVWEEGKPPRLAGLFQEL